MRQTDVHMVNEMSRYIALNKVLSELGLDHKDYVYIDKHEVAERIKKIPSIDIVRCKECKHWWNKYGDSACMLHSDFTVDADDFCSYGEREGE